MFVLINSTSINQTINKQHKKAIVEQIKHAMIPHTTRIAIPAVVTAGMRQYAIRYQETAQQAIVIGGSADHDAITVPCPAGRYGHECQNNCSGYCLNKEPCRFTTGVCLNGCSPGYDFKQDDKCKTGKHFVHGSIVVP
ncbi:hypothetical protein MAR_022973 [Mya arenaria]|uniref:TIL domain-containing protein n=1 Tax=Mya arenaria TaxID=6604 RepID=A0ABY7DUJ8_MYAAR|nr:hypothetical protein MAR_022973 [Mya arenaria]